MKKERTQYDFNFLSILTYPISAEGLAGLGAAVALLGAARELALVARSLGGDLDGGLGSSFLSDSSCHVEMRSYLFNNIIEYIFRSQVIAH